MADKITGTKEAFEEMISRRGIYKHLGVSKGAVWAWKNRKDSPVSLDLMEEMLLKYGATVISEKKWKLPKL